MLRELAIRNSASYGRSVHIQNTGESWNTHGYIFSDAWVKRGYLPHFNGQSIQFITFRLRDALPQSVLRHIQLTHSDLPSYRRNQSIRRDAERYCDKGYGSCVLKHADSAQIVAEVLNSYDGGRYRLLGYVIMPNHVHVLIWKNSACELGKIVGSWKSLSARRIASLYPTEFPSRKVWQRDYFDRFIRDERHFEIAMNYIRKNPEKAGLKDWPWLFEYRNTH